MFTALNSCDCLKRKIGTSYLPNRVDVLELHISRIFRFILTLVTEEEFAHLPKRLPGVFRIIEGSNLIDKSTHHIVGNVGLNPSIKDFFTIYLVIIDYYKQRNCYHMYHLRKRKKLCRHLLHLGNK